MDISVFDLIGLALAVALAMPLLVVGSECLISLVLVPFTKQSFMPVQLDKDVSYTILIPAHNEAVIIHRTLAKLIAELPGKDPGRIVVMADNCTDNTAEIARSLGVTVLERFDSAKRGKGFALDFGIRKINETGAPAILVIIDADCETTKDALCRLINLAARSHSPVQMTYLMRIPENAAIKQKVAGFAWILKNKVRPLALDSLGLPAALSGTGMAFPWQIIERVSMGNDNIVENMQLSFDCTLQGLPPLFCPDAVIYSDFPLRSTAERTQRTRWEHGHIQSIFKYLPVLTVSAYRQRDWRLLALALDAGVPPLSLLIVITLTGLLGLLALAALTGNAAAFYLLLTCFFYFAASLAVIWWRFGRDYLTPVEILAIPFYVMNKLPIYIAFLFKRQKEWVRTNRDVESF